MGLVRSADLYIDTFKIGICSFLLLRFLQLVSLFWLERGTADQVRNFAPSLDGQLGLPG